VTLPFRGVKVQRPTEELPLLLADKESVAVANVARVWRAPGHDRADAGLARSRRGSGINWASGRRDRGGPAA
jgi:hypothetical protein